ncbi:MAG: carboxyl transferase domain-containing protein [Thermoanaerobaculales bacterium]|jgi:acetyl-CoA carboxylase carboxyltransferase component|nr:carboxyl transferase domain-containing protein [Thermoanaerobaculales bacterium]
MPKLLNREVLRDEAFEANRDHWLNQLRIIEAQKASIAEGGGEKAAARQRSKGKLLARERVGALIDDGSDFLELGSFAAWEIYQEWGGAPSAGVVTGIGRVRGRDCVIVANDATVKAGAWFPLTCKKILRAQDFSMENRLPIIYLVDSAGVFLPMQDEIFPDRDHFGRVFYNNARLSAEGIYQISAIMGSCVAGGAYLPIMSDEALIVEGSGTIFLAGSHLVQAAIGERMDNQALGGAEVQVDISGVVDDRFPNDEAAIEHIRARIGELSAPELAPFDRIESRPPLFEADELLGLVPVDRSRPYSTHDLLGRLLDGSEFTEYKATYGRTLICGTGRIDGWAVGIVANDRRVVHRRRGLAQGESEMQIGGVIYSDAADKGARFVELMNQKGIPLLFLQDVTGFMVGSKSEREGIIKDGAKLVNVVANTVVPKITVFVGNSFGAGNYALCGRAYGARFYYSWPSASISVMGGQQASETLLAIQLKNRGDEVSGEERAELLAEIQARYHAATDPRYAAARLWVDEIIDPRKTREVVARSLAAAAHQPRMDPFRVGVLQT